MTLLVLSFNESRKEGKTISSDGTLQPENVHGASRLRYLPYLTGRLQDLAPLRRKNLVHTILAYAKATLFLKQPSLPSGMPRAFRLSEQHYLLHRLLSKERSPSPSIGG